MKKIMFNDRFGLTQAVLKGRKTQTREIIPLTYQEEEYLDYGGSNFDLRESVIIDYYALYKIGEIVAVAQSYHDAGIQLVPIQDKVLRGKSSKSKWGNAAKLPGWHNKQLTRADLMPHQIQITNVRVERMRDISDDDCMREGVEKEERTDGEYNYIFFDAERDLYIRERTPRAAYARLTDSLFGKGTWYRKPYVFVYDFELVK